MTQMEQIGYVLSEAPVFFLVIWFAVRLVQFRRYRNNRPIFTATDRRLLDSRPRIAPSTVEFYCRFVVAVLAVTAIGILEFIVLAPFGAAIVSGTLLLSSAAIVRRMLLLES